MTGGGPTLFCTDTVAERFADRIALAAPRLDIVTLRGDDLVPDDELERIELAFFSADAFPERSAHFMGAAVRTPNLRWLHTFSAGTDHPIFTSLPRPWRAGDHVVGRLGHPDRPHRDDVPPGAQPRPARPAARPGRAPLGPSRPTTTSRARPSASSGWARSGSRSSAWPRPWGCARSACAGPSSATSRARRGRSIASPSWPGVVDVLVLALPLTDDTRGIVSAAVLDGMRPGARFVNVGRGELVDEPALVRALADGHLGGAGLDVFTAEPLPADSPLWDLPNVIITPHSSALTAATGAGAVEIFLTNLARYVRGEPLLNER